MSESTGTTTKTLTKTGAAVVSVATSSVATAPAPVEPKQLQKRTAEEMMQTQYSPGAPTAALAAPGVCQFGEEWTSVALTAKATVSHDTKIFTFACPDRAKALGLSTCACILARGGKDDKEGGPVVRPYTPVSTNATVGTFDLMVKIYEKGVMSQHLDKMSIGETLEFKHIKPNVKLQFPFKKAQVAMLVGGTGVTPMIQALHAILGSEGDTTKVTMLYGNRTQKDILGKETLDAWCQLAAGAERLEVVHVLSQEPDGSDWAGERGFIAKELMQSKLPPPSSDCLILVCGPPPMYAALCGARGEKELGGALLEMGYAAEQVFKF